MKKLLIRFNALFLVLVLSIPAGTSAQESKDEVYYFKKGKAALELKQFGDAVKHFKKADDLRSNHPTIMQYVASACSRVGQKECTFRYLRKLGLINADLSILQDSVFQRWKRSSFFNEIRSFYEQMNKQVTTSEVAFEIPEKDLHPESIAYDVKTGNFYISSIRKRKIVRRKSDGSFEPFITEGLLAASGMKVDTAGNCLWVASPAPPEMEGYKKSMHGQSYVFKVDLETGEILKKYEVEDENEHFFGDLAIGTDGNIYVTDSMYPAIYVINEKTDSISLLKHFTDLRSLQGITWIPGDKSFFFADYVNGIYRHDIMTGKTTKIDPVQELSLKGIDGLYFFQNSLIAVQNGVRPMRITRLHLDQSLTGVESFDYLEKNNPVLDEPTLGTIVDDLFYYVANSPWGKYNRRGEMLPVDKLEKGLILKTPLKE